MDCPTCGFANPPETSRCHCGYAFEAIKPAEAPGWAISLAWRQSLAAYWSISWPAWVASLVLALVVTSPYSAKDLQGHLSAVSLVRTLAFFGIQAALTHRLVRKNYRSFRVYVIRQEEQRGRRLSIREAGKVWLRILWPQLVFLLISALILWWCRDRLQPSTLRALSTLSEYLLLLAVGPFAVSLALRVRYPAFRLQAYGYRYI
jgi:hypothetical protein